MLRWPTAGSYAPFGGVEGYRAFVDAVIGTGTVLDEGMVYLDARLSRKYPTVEVRVADVCRESDDAVLVAALIRALVETAIAEWHDGVEPDSVRMEVLRLAMWRAARSGIDADLIDPTTWRPAPAADVLGRLVDHVTPALEEAGDLLTVGTLLAAVLERGTGAHRQRAVYERTADFAAVARDALHR
jgi:carboxylate-amine ligase